MVNHSRISIKARSRIPLFFPDHEDAIRALVELGANIGARNARQETPLHLAAYWGKSFIRSSS